MDLIAKFYMIFNRVKRAKDYKRKMNGRISMDRIKGSLDFGISCDW